MMRKLLFTLIACLGLWSARAEDTSETVYGNSNAESGRFGRNADAAGITA